MTNDEFLRKIEKLRISDKLPNDPGLFKLHQSAGYLLYSASMPKRENNYVEREINPEFIEPIP